MRIVSQIAGTTHEFDDPEREMVELINYLSNEFAQLQEIRKDAAKRMDALGITHGFAD